MKKVVCGLFLLAGAGCFAGTQNLWNVFQSASQNAAYNQANIETQHAAINAYRSNVSTLFPQVLASADYIAGNYDSGTVHGSYRAHVYTLKATQQIFNPFLWTTVATAYNTAQSANASYGYAHQAFVQDVIKRYFSVLEAKDEVNVDTAHAAYLKRVFDQSVAQYKVGVATVTSVRQAQASYKGAEATLIAAKNGLSDARLALKAITNEPIGRLAPLNSHFAAHNPDPANAEKWVKMALGHNNQLHASHYQTLATKDELDNRISEFLPKISLVGTIIKPDTDASDAVSSGTGIGHQINRSVALELDWNLFTGPTSLDLNGANPCSVSEGANLYTSAQFTELQTLRNLKASVRQDYANVEKDVANVRQYKASVAAGESAVSQYEAMFKVGTATMTDYLEQVSELYKNKEKLFKAEYGYINDYVQLKLDAGILSNKEIVYLNSLLS